MTGVKFFNCVYIRYILKICEANCQCAFDTRNLRVIYCTLETSNRVFADDTFQIYRKSLIFYMTLIPVYLESSYR